MALVAFSVVLFFSLFRGDNIGIDTINYLDVRTHSEIDLSNIELDSNTKFFEFSTNFVYYLIENWHFPKRTIISFFSIVTFAFIYLSSKQFKVKLGYLLFFFTLGGLFLHSFNISRQIAAISVVLYSLYFIFESPKKSILFFLYILIATSIHGACLYLSVLYIFRWVKISQKKAVLAILLLSPFFLFNIISPLNLLINYSPVFFVEHYYDDFNTRDVSILGYVAGFLCLGIQVLLLQYSPINKRMTLFVVAILVTCITGHLPTIIMRLFIIFDFIVCLFYSEYLEKCNLKLRMPVKALMSLYFTYTFLSAVSRTPSIYPYNFCF